MNEDAKDLDAVARCLDEGDLEAFGELVERYQRPIFNVVLHMVKDTEDAREISQQVFMSAFEHLPTFSRERRFFSWIYRMAINAAINHLAARRPLEPLSESLVANGSSPERDCESRETSQHLRGAILSLKPEYRSVVILRHIAQCSYQEVAEVLGLPEAIVKSRLFTARNQLRGALAARGYRR